jgi:hypothetical protein
VIQNWDPSSFTLSTQALSRIIKGEELLTSYLDNALVPRAERREQLAKFYEFECSCPSCALPPDESLKSDENRRLLSHEFRRIYSELSKATANDPGFDAEFGAWLNDASLPDDHLLSHSREIIRLMDQERVGGTMMRVFHCMSLVRGYSALGDEKNMRYWAGRIIPVLDPRFSFPRDLAVRVAAIPELEENWRRRVDRKLQAETDV